MALLYLNPSTLCSFAPDSIYTSLRVSCLYLGGPSISNHFQRSCIRLMRQVTATTPSERKVCEQFTLDKIVPILIRGPEAPWMQFASSYKVCLQNNPGLQKKPKWYVHLAINPHCCCTKQTCTMLTRYTLSWIEGMLCYANEYMHFSNMFLWQLFLTNNQACDFPQSYIMMYILHN